MCGGVYACNGAAVTFGDERNAICSAENNGFGLVNIAVACWGVGVCKECADPEMETKPARTFSVDQFFTHEAPGPQPGDKVCMPIYKSSVAMENGCLTLHPDSINIFSLVEQKMVVIQCQSGICSEVN